MPAESVHYVKNRAGRNAQPCNIYLRAMIPIGPASVMRSRLGSLKFPPNSKQPVGLALAMHLVL